MRNKLQNNNLYLSLIKTRKTYGVLNKIVMVLNFESGQLEIERLSRNIGHLKMNNY